MQSEEEAAQGSGGISIPDKKKNNTFLLCLGTWFSGGLDSAGLMGGIYNLRGLFQPRDLLSEWKREIMQNASIISTCQPRRKMAEKIPVQNAQPSKIWRTKQAILLCRVDNN